MGGRSSCKSADRRGGTSCGKGALAGSATGLESTSWRKYSHLRRGLASCRLARRTRTFRAGGTLNQILRDRFIIERGRTLPFAELPPHTIALDGYVQGPAIDTAQRRFSFDHHAGCIRHVTLSTCEMTLDALRVGLDPTDLTICINDLDADTVLAAWLLTRPEAAAHEAVATAVRSAGRWDALGPAVGGAGLVAALAWALEPMSQADAAGKLRAAENWQVTWGEVLRDCLARLDRWFAAGAPAAAAEFAAPPRPAVELMPLHDGGHWQLVLSRHGIGAFAALYQQGVRAAIVAKPLGDGSTEYTVGKASEFVSGFDVPAILSALREAELLVNPGQPSAHNWGGGSTIGGSPRNADGSASRLAPPEVASVVAKVLALGQVPAG